MSGTHSVIMPVFNGEKHVGEALASALGQLGPDDEIIVVDNGSTDGTVQLVASHPDRRVRLIHEAKRGPAAARNAGLAKARGDYVSMLDHDDLWPEGRLNALVEMLEQNPESNAAIGRVRVLFEAGPEPDYEKMDGSGYDTLVLGMFLFRASFLSRVGRFDEALQYGEDSDFLLRARQAGLRYVRWDGEALCYRRHGGNMTRNRREAARAIFGVLSRHLARKRERS